MTEEQKSKPADESRRQFLKKSGYTFGGILVGGVLGGAIGEAIPDIRRGGERAAPAAPKTGRSYVQGLMFFNQEMYMLTEAAAERIFPKDESGPGAKELGAAFYIDHQLAGQWGINARDYMLGPFRKGEETQGYQARMKRHEIFSAGLAKLKTYSMQKYGKTFTELDEDQQISVLTDFEEGKKVDIPGIASSSSFFDMLRQLTMEGVYADPMYGGNIDMDGWKMRNYPGAQMSYFNDIDNDEFKEIEPVSLHGMLAT